MSAMFLTYAILWVGKIMEDKSCVFNKNCCMTILVLTVCWHWNLVGSPQDHGHRCYEAFFQETLHAILINTDHGQSWIRLALLELCSDSSKLTGDGLSCLNISKREK